MVPEELSVKETVSGLTPLVGRPLKLAVGTSAPLPRTALVELPPLLVKTTTLLKLPAVAGAKRTGRLVEPNPARLKGVPDTRLKGPAHPSVWLGSAPPISPYALRRLLPAVSAMWWSSPATAATPPMQFSVAERWCQRLTLAASRPAGSDH